MLYRFNFTPSLRGAYAIKQSSAIKVTFDKKYRDTMIASFNEINFDLNENRLEGQYA